MSGFTLAQRVRLGVAGLAFTLAVATLAGPAATLVGALPNGGPPTFSVRGSVHQLFVIGAPAGAAVELRDRHGHTVHTATTDSLGGLVFHSVAPGAGYTAVVSANGASAQSGPVTVLGTTNPPRNDPRYTGQGLTYTYPGDDRPRPTSGTPGYGYVATRDGTTLSAFIQLPGPPVDGSGHPVRYPTLVEYSGYQPSDPTAGDQSRVFRLFASALGYAYVGVNVRGSGCSGGAFDFFEQLQSLDGYDVIETLAAQPWAARIGMFGISYPGISQLFVAATQPPDLAAIAPLSVISDTFRGTLYPGGISNDGFALSWATERVNQNRWPSPTGADWVVDRVTGGDPACTANMLLRQQNQDLLAQTRANPFYPAVGNADHPHGGDSLAPWSFVDKIKVPTFLAGAWNDEQTGPYWATMANRFTSVPPHELRITAYNGAHADALGPDVILRLEEFLEFYVARRIPVTPSAVRAAAPVLYDQILGVSGLQLPPDRFAGYSSFPKALHDYEAERPVRILWESGAAPGQQPGAPLAVAETSYASWPAPGTTPTAWYFQPDGALSASPPAISDDAPRGADAYHYDPGARPRADYSGASSAIWHADPSYNWVPLVDGKALSFVSDSLPHDVTMLGVGSVDLWLKSTAPDTDLQVTLSEVRPDGQERYVQDGWLRASHRKLDPRRSTVLDPVQTQLQADATPLPAGHFTLARVELFPFGYVFRAGSRVRVSVEAPGGDRPLWTFAALTVPPGGETSWIAHSVGRASRVVLPVIPNVSLPAGLAPCPSLRGEPCRAYVPSGAPRGVTATFHRNAVRVTWSAPSVPPGRTLTGYTVLADHGAAPRSVGTGITRVSFRGLAAGETYSFTVVANYTDGQSPPSTPSNTATTPMLRMRVS